MVLRILRGSFGRQLRRKAVAFTAVALGTTAASALLQVSLGIGDQVNRELKAFGANLVVTPAGQGRALEVAGTDVSSLRAPQYLAESDIGAAKDNFWVNNVLALAPMLDTEIQAAGSRLTLRGTWFERREQLPDGREYLAGVRAVFPFWSVEGRWPRDTAPDEVLAGASVARALGLRQGSRIVAARGDRAEALSVVGILSTGTEEDEMLLAPLALAQRLAALEGSVSRILVSALTTPEEAALSRLGLDPTKFSPAEFEKWSCTPFASSIAYEIARSVPRSEVRAIRRVAESEGRILTRVGGLMGLIAAMAAIAAALTVTSSLMTGVLERKAEIGLLKAMGATNGIVIGLFLLEATLLGAGGGIAGAVLGAGLARIVSVAVFGSPVALSPLAVPLAIVAAIAITLAGCALPARRIVAFRPYEVLHGL
jgi:putative ABC transport system permease protein